jgi:protein ImuA
MSASANLELARLLEHPAIWRGRSAARAEVLPTGCAAFDACLPGGGWPRTGLIEILVSRFGVGELYLLFPALAALTRRPGARWCVWVAPPLEPYAPALSAHGAALERMLVVRPSVTERPARESPAGSRRGNSQRERPSADRAASEGTPSGGQRGNPQRGRAPDSLWAFEETLGSGASDIALAWATRSPKARAIRRLQLAAVRGKTLGVLFRPLRAARESSAAVLRIAVEPKSDGARITLLKSRGGARGSIEVQWTAGWSMAPAGGSLADRSVAARSRSVAGS